MLRNPTPSPTLPQPSIRSRTASAIPSSVTSLAAAPLADAEVLAVACADVAGDVPAALLDGRCGAHEHTAIQARLGVRGDAHRDLDDHLAARGDVAGRGRAERDPARRNRGLTPGVHAAGVLGDSDALRDVPLVRVGDV